MLERLLSPRLLRLLRLLFWGLALFALTMALLPKPPGTPIDSLGDKFAHMLAFTVLAAVAALAWPDLRRTHLLVGLSLFGAAIEVLQMIPVLHRDSDWRDWVADTVVVLAVLALARLVSKPRALP